MFMPLNTFGINIQLRCIKVRCIKRQSMNIYKAGYSRRIIEKDVGKLILCCFVPCVLLNFKASAAESGIYHGLKTKFLESTVH
jgi:hypothetical protein